MSALSSAPASAGGDETSVLSGKSWWLFLVFGAMLVAFGTFAIGWACLTTITIAATWAFGVLLLVGGAVEIVSSFSAGRFRGVLVHLLIGVLYVVAGWVMIDRPAESAVLLTKFLAIFLIIGGAFRILSALSHRYPHWGMVLLSGGISLLLGISIYSQWPASGLWFIGLAIGVDMILSGWTWIMLALGLRRTAAVV